MSATPEHAHNVESMAEFLEGTYRFVRKMDRYTHAVLRQIEGRLYALRLADDPKYRERREEIQKMIDSGSLPEDAEAFEQVASRYGADSGPK